jgi:hypothetical protein
VGIEAKSAQKARNTIFSYQYPEGQNAHANSKAHNKNSCLKLHAFDLKFDGNMQLIKNYNYCEASIALQSLFILMWE